MYIHCSYNNESTTIFEVSFHNTYILLTDAKLCLLTYVVVYKSLVLYTARYIQYIYIYTALVQFHNN